MMYCNGSWSLLDNLNEDHVLVEYPYVCVWVVLKVTSSSLVTRL